MSKCTRPLATTIPPRRYTAAELAMEKQALALLIAANAALDERDRRRGVPVQAPQRPTLRVINGGRGA